METDGKQTDLNFKMADMDIGKEESQELNNDVLDLSGNEEESTDVGSLQYLQSLMKYPSKEEVDSSQVGDFESVNGENDDVMNSQDYDVMISQECDVMNSQESTEVKSIEDDFASRRTLRARSKDMNYRDIASGKADSMKEDKSKKEKKTSKVEGPGKKGKNGFKGKNGPSGKKGESQRSEIQTEFSEQEERASITGTV